MEKKFNYVYIITNLINEKQYIGDHSTDDLKKDYYFGSGKNIKRAIKKYGKKNFKKEIIEFFNTKQEAFNAQEMYINQYNTLVPNGYNISPKGGMNVTNCYSDEMKKRMSLMHKGKKISDNQKICISKALKGRIKSEEERKKLSKSLSGHNHSEETKNKIRLKHIGKKISEETKNKLSKSTKGIKTVSKETKQKMSDARKKYWESKRKMNEFSCNRPK